MRKRAKQPLISSFAPLLIFCVATIFADALAQSRTVSKQKIVTAGAILKSEEPRLRKRLQLYIEYQKTEQWDELAKILGGERNAQGDRVAYSSEKRAELIELLRKMPMQSFSWNETHSSTEILSLPRSKKWWFLIGEAEYKMGEQKIQRKAMVEVYKMHGEWYFTPWWPTSSGYTKKPAS